MAFPIVALSIAGRDYRKELSDLSAWCRQCNEDTLKVPDSNATPCTDGYLSS